MVIVVALNNPVVHFWPSAAGTQGRNYLHGILSQQGNLNPGLVTQDDEEPDSRPPVNEKGTMRDEKRSFVLIVGADRVVATTLAGVLHAGGYMAGTTASSETMLRIASRMVIDVAVIEVGSKDASNLETAVALQERYPSCRILLLCGRSQADDVAFWAEETGLDCEVLVRPLSRSELLAKVSTPNELQPSHSLPGRLLHAA